MCRSLYLFILSSSLWDDIAEQMCAYEQLDVCVRCGEILADTVPAWFTGVGVRALQDPQVGKCVGG